MVTRPLPIAVVGAGPVGLAAAAHLMKRGLPVKVYEVGRSVGTNMRQWGHVRLFTPWKYVVDEAARALLEPTGWRSPDGEINPTGAELVEHYLEPLAATAELRSVIETGVRVVGMSRDGLDKVVSAGRENRPFLVMVADENGRLRRDRASAVIDASGTWATPNPIGGSGLPAEGEIVYADRITYGIPDVLGRDRSLYLGRTTLVLGAGHSAANALLDLARLAEEEPATSFVWVTRGTDLSRVYGGGAADQLAARGELGSRLRDLVSEGRMTLISGFSVTAIREQDGRLAVDGETSDGPQIIAPVDRIIAATGQQPDLSITRELRLELDPWLESTRALGPLIDPNLHSCGSVPPHGHRELSHPEKGFYTVGIKSYGRAPTFLMLTGYEQVRSIAAALAGDLKAANEVHLVLPETGVCSSTRVVEELIEDVCCGGPAPAGSDACCSDEAVSKAKAGEGCGCGTTTKGAIKTLTGCC